MTPTLISITALARSGAEELAWRLFRSAGFDRVTEDPAVFALHGRLLKDRALALSGVARREAAAEAASAYAAAARLRPATYPLINAATLSLIAGEPGLALGLADEALALLENGGGEPDTPYYLEATRAEALLLRGETDAAKASFRAALALAPRAWEDHASTLRQFSTILAELGTDAAWLDACRPPRTLHYAGQMRIRNDATQAEEIDAALEAANIGFGFGALAAGADMLIAERLLARGAELHVTLPGSRAAFLARSVEAYGADAARFEAILAQAASIREIAEADDAPPELLGELADELAMGGAVMRARQLQTSAAQLVVSETRDGQPLAPNSARLARIWSRTGRAQHLIEAGASPAGGTDVDDGHGAQLAAILAVSLAESGRDPVTVSIAERLAALPQPAGMIAPPAWRSDGVVLHFGSAADATAEALRLRTALIAGGPVRIAGDLGIVRVLPAPFGGGALVMGAVARRVDRVLEATPSTAIHFSEYLGAAFAAGTSADETVRLELVGELPDQALDLYALR